MSPAASSRTTATSCSTAEIAVGDAELTLPGIDAPFAPASTVVTSAIMQAVVATAAGTLAERGIDPPLLRSGNVDGGHDWNAPGDERVRGPDLLPAVRRAGDPNEGSSPPERRDLLPAVNGRPVQSDAAPARSRAAAIRAATSSA